MHPISSAMCAYSIRLLVWESDLRRLEHMEYGEEDLHDNVAPQSAASGDLEEGPGAC